MSSSRMARLDDRPRTRAWVKSVSWRIWALVVLGVLGWIITGSAVQTTAIALTYNAIQIPAFYLHERWWERHRDHQIFHEDHEDSSASARSEPRTR